MKSVARPAKPFRAGSEKSVTLSVSAVTSVDTAPGATISAVQAATDNTTTDTTTDITTTETTTGSSAIPPKEKNALKRTWHRVKKVVGNFFTSNKVRCWPLTASAAKSEKSCPAGLFVVAESTSTEGSSSKVATSTTDASTATKGPSACDASTATKGPSTSDASTATEGPTTSDASTATKGPSTSDASTAMKGPSTSDATSATAVATTATIPTKGTVQPAKQWSSRYCAAKLRLDSLMKWRSSYLVDGDTARPYYILDPCLIAITKAEYLQKMHKDTYYFYHPQAMYNEPATFEREMVALEEFFFYLVLDDGWVADAADGDTADADADDV